jgi:hypothetical protein
MPPALADFFFIAGLEGNEPAILNIGEQASTFRSETTRDASPVQEMITKQPISTGKVLGIDSLRPAIASDERRATSSSSADYADYPSTPATSIVSDPPSALGSNSNALDDIVTKFSSEIDGFLSTLSPPTMINAPKHSPSPSPFQSPVTDEEYDQVAELHPTPSSPVRSRTLRGKIADISRLTSRSNTLRRTNTISSQHTLF